LRIVFTAGEELGCQGISSLVKEKRLQGKASAIIVGEPTSNQPVTGHKGAIYLKAKTSGRTAHSSMPELGINAIYKAANAINKISLFGFEAEKDPLLGYPTINVGSIAGGMNINSVPDFAEFTVDIRTTTMTDHGNILEKLKREIGSDVTFDILVDLKPVFTPESDPFVQTIYNICGINNNSSGYPKALPYLTDGAVLQRFYSGAPCVILGPGDPELAHKTDEYCIIDNLEKSVELYRSIILNSNH
jgi:succinyl-diaminopimelate desuccinylase